MFPPTSRPSLSLFFFLSVPLPFSPFLFYDFESLAVFEVYFWVGPRCPFTGLSTRAFFFSFLRQGLERTLFASRSRSPVLATTLGLDFSSFLFADACDVHFFFPESNPPKCRLDFQSSLRVEALSFSRGFVPSLNHKEVEERCCSCLFFFGFPRFFCLT